MPVHLMGPNPLHLDLLQGTLSTAGWQASELHVQPSPEALEQALQATPVATLVLDLGQDENAEALHWLAPMTRRWPLLQVVALSARRNETLLLQAMRSGVREVLDSPPEPGELLQVLERLRVSVPTATGQPVASPGASTGVLAFVSSKGGCGSTLMASNLAWLLATEFQRECTLLDLDLLYGDASFYVGGGSARHSMAELMRQGTRLDSQLLRSSLHPVHERLHLLAAPTVPSLGLPPVQALARVVALLRQQQQVVVMDVPHQVDELGLQALKLADRVFVLLGNRVPDVRNAQRLMRLLREQGIPVQRLAPVLNRHPQEGGLDPQAIDKAIEPALAHRIADDPQALQACVHLGLPLHEHAPGSPVLRDLRLLAASALDLPVPRKRGWLSRWIGSPR
jgi:pilus assembly protein CpaE